MRASLASSLALALLSVTGHAIAESGADAELAAAEKSLAQAEAAARVAELAVGDAEAARGIPERRVLAAEPTKANVPFEHAPLSTADAGEPLSIRAKLGDAIGMKRMVVVYRTLPSDTPRVAVMHRKYADEYVATIPEERVARPTVFYSIEMERADGTRRNLFATRERQHRIQVLDDASDVRERALLERLDGRRSVLETRGEYVSFGESSATVLEAPDVPRNVLVEDMYWRMELGYRYRFLGFVSHLGMRAGVIRGHAPIAASERPEDQSEDRFDVGLNYVAPTVRFRLHDLVHVDGDVLTSITDDGFAFGGGGALLIGDPLATRLELSFEGIEDFGIRFGGRMAIAATDWLLFAPEIEVTNMPNAEEAGVRLLGEIVFRPGAGLSLTARGGYQARESTGGGASFGGAVGYAF